MIRAIMEGTAFAIAHNLSIIESLGIHITEVRAVGGPTRSALWCQIIADITGRTLNVVSNLGGAPLGNALLAAQGVGLIQDAAEIALKAARIEHSYQPDASLHERYQALFDIYFGEENAYQRLVVFCLAGNSVADCASSSVVRP
jgi:xylulokinase